MGPKVEIENLVVFDGKQLAEGGVAAAYASVLPLLFNYVEFPARVDEANEAAARRYVVRSGEKKFVIRAPELEEKEDEHVGRAIHALFTIVNEQLTKCDARFYCVNLGDELQGMFLTVAQAYLARRTLPEKLDWPYLPTDEDPWYGQHH